MSDWRTINISPRERAARIAVGAIGVIGGIVLLTRAGSIITAILEALLVLAGADLLVTGALGHCPLYTGLGCVPTTVKGRSS